MLVLVNAPLAHQRKLAEGADRSTTHHAKTDQPEAVFFLRQRSKPNPARPEAKSGSAAGRGTAAVVPNVASNTWPLVTGDVPAQFSVVVVPSELIVSVKPPGKVSPCLA